MARSCLQTAPRDTVDFDKTGTLSEHPLAAAAMSAPSVLAVANSLGPRRFA